MIQWAVRPCLPEHAGGTNGIQIGYARVSTADQELTSQRDGLLRLGVLDSNIYVDRRLTGMNRARPGLREALAAVRAGDTLVVTKLDRLARSVKDARDIADELTTKGVALSLGCLGGRGGIRLRLRRAQAPRARTTRPRSRARAGRGAPIDGR